MGREEKAFLCSLSFLCPSPMSLPMCPCSHPSVRASVNRVFRQNIHSPPVSPPTLPSTHPAVHAFITASIHP